MIKGFSTGAIAKGDFRKALKILENSDSNAVELSALREFEILTLIDSLSVIQLDKYEYVSIHAPSKLVDMSESQLIELLHGVVAKGFPVVVHPDIIINFDLWTSLGPLLYVENMDKRKKSGRSFIDLAHIFSRLPNASFCFDIAHAAQVDPSMTEAYLMLSKFSNRLKEVHISSVNSQSVHETISWDSLIAFSKVAHLIPEDVPIIFESPVSKDYLINLEMQKLSYLFGSGNLRNKKSSVIAEQAYRWLIRC